MGILDGAAQGLMSRLENVGVPRVIAHVMGQCAYVPSGRRHHDIPQPIVGKTEITWLVDQYEKELRDVDHPVMKAAYVQALCEKVFGPNAEEILIAGYPELAVEPPATHVDEAFIRQEQAEAAERLLSAAGRYFTAGYDPGAPDVAQVLCTLEQQKTGPIEGALIIMNESICFFDPADFAVEDPDDGSPILIEIENIKSCRLVRSDRFAWDRYRAFQVQRWFRDAVLLEIQTAQGQAKFLINLENFMPGQRAAVEQDLRKFLYVLDREILYHES